VVRFFQELEQMRSKILQIKLKLYFQEQEKIRNHSFYACFENGFKNNILKDPRFLVGDEHLGLYFLNPIDGI
jgi:hypothetical protein